MATSATTMAHIADTLGAIPLRYTKMFGEYSVYLDDKVVAMVSNDTLFIKPTPGALALLPDVEKGPPYPGAKDWIIGAEVLDDPDTCVRVLRTIASELPPPKPKKPKKPKSTKVT
jgi:TfoX/Sxy family transcriptional regulator of competence genes